MVCDAGGSQSEQLLRSFKENADDWFGSSLGSTCCCVLASAGYKPVWAALVSCWFFLGCVCCGKWLDCNQAKRMNAAEHVQLCPCLPGLGTLSTAFARASSAARHLRWGGYLAVTIESYLANIVRQCMSYKTSSQCDHFPGHCCRQTHQKPKMGQFILCLL